MQRRDGPFCSTAQGMWAQRLRAYTEVLGGELQPCNLRCSCWRYSGGTLEERGRGWRGRGAAAGVGGATEDVVQPRGATSKRLGVGAGNNKERSRGGGCRRGQAGKSRGEASGACQGLALILVTVALSWWHVATFFHYRTPKTWRRQYRHRWCYRVQQGGRCGLEWSCARVVQLLQGGNPV